MNKRGFTLIEALLIMTIIGASFFGLGLIFSNIDQQALSSDLTVMATQLARERMEEVIAVKASGGYSSLSSEGPTAVTSGEWDFSRSVVVSYISPSDFSTSFADTGYKRVVIQVDWGSGSGQSISLQTILTDQVPSAIVGGGYAACP